MHDKDAVYPHWCKASAYLVFIILGLECDESLRRRAQSRTAALGDPAATTGPAVSSPCGIPKIFNPPPDLPGNVMSAFAKWALLV